MRTLYVYRQTIDWMGTPTSYISLSEQPPDHCTLSAPVECLGALQVLPITEIEVEAAR